MFISITLAKIIGLYCVLVGLAMLFNQARFKKMMQDFMQFPVVLDLAGIFVLILGLIVVVIHNVWVTGWPVLVTIMSWFVLLKGAVLLFKPEVIVGMSRKMLTGNTYYCFSSIATLVLGIIFCYFGFVPR